MNQETDRPNTIPWPPIILITAIAVAVGLQVVLPMKLSPVTEEPVVRLAGGIAMLLGLVLDASAILAMRKHNTNILPNRAADKLLTTGVFGLSRNPIYTGNTLLLAGAGIAFAIPWLIIGAFASAAAIQTLAIKREERHLAAKFGTDWLSYAEKTPRWLFF